MSKFLAPIHGWLFNKILILEKVEKRILVKVDDQYEAHREEAVNKYGDFLPNQPLEALIDKSNIHGWLQSVINNVESRQALFIGNLLNEGLEKEVIEAYYEVGLDEGKTIEVNEPSEALNALNNVLLEGMPCDRVIEIIQQDSHHVKWLTKLCVHKSNWESNGTPVENYYTFRAAFTKGFVQSLNENYVYEYINSEQQIHEIKEK